MRKAFLSASVAAFAFALTAARTAWGAGTVDYAGYRLSDGTPQAVLLSYYDGPDTRGFAWQTSTDTTSGALWLLSGNYDASADAMFATNQVATAVSVKKSDCVCHKAHALGLKPGTYSYRLGTTDRYAYGSFTVKAQTNPFVALSFSDVQTKDVSKIGCWDVTLAAAQSVLGGSADVDMFLSGGDFIDNGTSYSNYIEWGVAADRARAYFPDVTWTMLSGNHDPDLYNVVIDENFQYTVSGHYGCHAYDVGNVHIASVPYYSSWNADVGTWLANDLAACTSTWRVVCIHYGPYTTVDHGSTASASYVKAVSGICAKGQVDLVLQAHDHGYSKTLPYLWSGAGYATSESEKATTVNVAPTVERISGEDYYKDPKGTVYVSTGCAGHRVGEGKSYATSTYKNRDTKIFVDTIKVGTLAGQDASLVPDNQMFAVLTVDGDKLSYDWYLAETDGSATLFDSLRLYKTAAPDDPDPDPDPDPEDPPEWIDNVSVTAVTAEQRYPWNGFVDVTVTFSGASNDVARTACEFFATNVATQTKLSFAAVRPVGSETGSDSVWTRRYVWDAQADVGAVKIDDVVLAVRPTIGGVQLWKDGPLWAECNVGAKSPEESGSFFSWGGTTAYEFADGSWRAADGSASGFSFTDGNCPTSGKDAADLASSGYVNAAGNLNAAHDAASVHLGSSWRMPTAAEYDALVANCTSAWTERFGVRGRLLTGKGDYASRSVFFPASGFGDGASLNEIGGLGRYWSSTPETGMIEGGCNLLFTPYLLTRVSVSRSFGQNVRPVRGASSVDFSAASVATHLALDCRTGLRIANATERIRFSPDWESSANGAAATVKLDGVAVANGKKAGTFTWTPAKPGLYRFTHTVTAGGVSVGGTESVTFAVGVTDLAQLYAPAANGERVIDCYLAGIDPAGPGEGEPSSTFLAFVTAGEDAVSVSWSPDLNDGSDARIYTVLGCDDLETREWEELRPWHRFFKVVATMPTGAGDEESAVSGLSFVPQVKPEISGVQLWKDGPFWAEWNVGAKLPEEFGSLFAWGDTVGYTAEDGVLTRNDNGTGSYYADVTWVSSDGARSEEGPFWAKNCPTCAKSLAALKNLGYVDSDGNLARAHDAATVRLGAPWRLPTDDDFAALVANCVCERTTRNGVNGVLAKGRGAYASASVFFPAGGSGYESTWCSPNVFGHYWTSTTGAAFDAVQYLFRDGGFSRNDTWQNRGAAVRPVRDAE